MIDRSQRWAVQGRHVYCGDQPPISGGVVSIEGDRIVEVGKTADSRTIDLGDVAILPGLVNAHTHLEFSDLTEPLGSPGMSMADWIRLVVAHRRSQGAAPNFAAIAAGLAESIAAGTTTLGEIATTSWPVDYDQTLPLDMVAFFEQIGASAGACESKVEKLHAMMDRRSPNATWQAGISPHAPYTVHPCLLEATIKLSCTRRLPLAMHLAESLEEMQWMRSHDGPLHNLLVEFGAWDETTTSVGPRPLDYLQRLTKAHRALVVHGNYLDDEEIAFCGAHADSMAVVFCPRTHARFGHAPYPLAKMLAAGVCVALGTDSRASNPDLSLLGEMKQIAATHRDVSPETILSLGTLAGALALGRADQIGSLAVGKLANLAIIELPGDAQSNDPSALFAADSTGIATVVRGEIVYDPQNRFARQSPR